MANTTATEHLVPELVLPDTDDAAASDVPVVAPPNYDEPVVTRRELWSYYRTCRVNVILRHPLQIIISVL